MANFVAVVDADAARRDRFIRDARRRIAFLDHLRIGSIECGPFAAVWAATEGAPVSATSSAEDAALLFGDALAGPGSESLDAGGLLRAWRGSDAGPPPAFDGYHAALLWSSKSGLTAAADILGVFPIYFAFAGHVAVVGSSPELFGAHPLFPPVLSPQGLVDLLLSHAILNGRTLLRNVVRLKPAHALRWRPPGPCEEVRQYEITRSAAFDSLSFDEHVELLLEVYEDVLRRHVPAGAPVGLLLSGGMDSRLIAGCLAEMGIETCALTLGRAGDYETDIAAAVARTLGFGHVRHDLSEELYAGWADTQARWEHLAGGFSSIHTWGIVEPLRGLPNHCINGQVFGIREIPFGPASADELFESPLTFGIRPAALRELLRPPLREMVDQTCADLRAAWESEVGDDPGQDWRFALLYRIRSHPGGRLWALSFGSWPILHMLDRRLLDLLASVPQRSLEDRRWSEAALRRRFPALARIPIDRNSHNTMPLQTSALRQIANPLLVAARRLRRAVRGPRAERRYFYRVYDIDGAGWFAIRAKAEPQRDALKELFEPSQLDLVLPPPDRPLRPAHAIRDAFGPKLLIGFMLWAADHSI